MLSVGMMWAVKILLVLRRAAAAGSPLMKGRQLQAACVGPGTDLYIYRRTLRRLVAKTDYITCVFQSGKTSYSWNPNCHPTLYDLAVRLEGEMHEASNIFWSYENLRAMQPLRKVCMDLDRLLQGYLSEIRLEELEPSPWTRPGRSKLAPLHLLPAPDEKQELSIQ